MKLFSLFGTKEPKNDPYWEFDQERHFRPKINLGDFYRLTGYDIISLIVKPTSKFVGHGDTEKENARYLSYPQKALLFWLNVDGQVTNGGFVQLYYNRFGRYVPATIKGLLHIGDKTMAELIQKAEDIYQKNKRLMEKAMKKDLFGSDLYERLSEMGELDTKYYKINAETLSNFEKYIRNHPDQFCVDEEGREFDMNYTGEYKVFYNSKKLKDHFYVASGLVDGVFTRYYENGNIQKQSNFIRGVPTGESSEYFENGNKKYTVSIDSESNQLECSSYYENGTPDQLEHKRIDKNERIGEFKKWYDNGQLAESGTYVSAYQREGKWLEFFKNGQPRKEADFINGVFHLHNSWNEDGEQTLKDGTGTDYVGNMENQYKNYKRHGTQKMFSDGVLILYQEMEDGVLNGYTRTYYKTGKLKTETLYTAGGTTSVKNYSLFENPRVQLNIFSKVCTACYKDQQVLNPPDNEPELLNREDLEKSFKADKSLFGAYSDQEQIITYSYIVTTDANGNVTDLKFASADNMWIAKDVEKSMSRLKYGIAYRNTLPTACIFHVMYKLKLTD
ncbi:MAG: DUF4375 domain-containing protein [Sphingobacteriales bacterium]|nr:MAG: DUF4375 domain-containing protein [Sphingobacteriales bacterium]